MNPNALIASLVLLCVMGTHAGAAAPIEISSPTDYQVAQRESRTIGRVHVSGRLQHAMGRLQIRWTGNSADGRLPDSWTPIDADASGDFSADVSIPAGGWYALELRETEADNVIATQRVDHVGVGEVFVVAGQSNSTNYGSERQHPETGLVSTFDGKGWRLADDPQPGTQDRGKGGSFIPAFGDAMARRFHVPIGVACCGAGATSVRQWLTTGERIDVPPTTSKAVRKTADGHWECTGQLYAGLMKRIDALGPHGFRALLWHQGESDVNQAPGHQITAQKYREYLERIIRETRKDAGWPIPWFVAQATYHSAQDASNTEFRAAQKAVCEDGLALPGPDTDALGPDYRAGVHFNAKGLQAHGHLWADKVGPWLDTTLAAADHDKERK